MIVFALGLYLSGTGLNRCAAQAVTNPLVSSTKNMTFVNVKATATASKLTAGTSYKVQFVAVDAAKNVTVLDGGSNQMAQADGTINYTRRG